MNAVIQSGEQKFKGGEGGHIGKGRGPRDGGKWSRLVGCSELIETTIAELESELHPIWNMRHTMEILFVWKHKFSIL